MKKLLLSLTLVFLASTMNINAQSVPLIDRALLFDAPEYSGAQISPDGRYISFMKPFNGTQNVFVKGIDEPF